MTILALVMNGKPLAFFSLGAVACTLVSLLLAISLFTAYVETGLVPRFPTAILCAVLVLLAPVSWYMG